jgi:hypothetical protein
MKPKNEKNNIFGELDFFEKDLIHVEKGFL